MTPATNRALMVLVVDDVADDAALLRLELRRAGLANRITHVDRVEDLRAALARQDWDVVISDYNMPDMTPALVMDELRQRDADTPLVVVTGMIGEEAASELMRCGVADLVLKTNLTRLAPAVEREVAAAAARRAGHAAEQARGETQALLVAVAANLSGVIFRRLVDGDGKPTYPFVSRDLAELHGFPAAEAGAAHSFAGMIAPQDRDPIAAAYALSARTLEPMEIDHRVTLPNGETRWMRVRATPAALPGGAVQWDGIALDVTAQTAAEHRSDYLARHDQLTGLPNQSLLADRLGQALLHARRDGGRVAVVAVQIDTLTAVQDGAGLSAADALLRLAGHRLQQSLGQGDTVAHLGAGQFCGVVALDPGDAGGSAEAQQLIARILDGFASPFALGDQSLHLRPCLGISLFPADGSEVEALLGNAATALHQARAAGQRRYQFYAADMTERAVARMTLEQDLRAAIAANELCVVYQPQVRPGNFEITGMEALVRWPRAQGMVSPADFIPLAEQTGLIVPLGEAVLRMACAQAARWQAEGVVSVPVSVNVSGLQLMRPEFAYRVMEALAANGLPPAMLKLELTESVIVRRSDTVRRTMDRLAEEGIGFAVDDFGIEHAALSHLSQLPIDTLKVDHVFVSRMGEGPSHVALSQAIVAMAHAMGKRAVAEGVETMQELAQLQGFGCDALQGYLFSRPVPAETMTALLRQGRLPPSPA